MQVLPVVARELRVAARRPGPYLARAGAALGAVGLFAWVAYFTRLSGFTVGLGRDFFNSLTWIATLLAAPTGVALAGDSLTSEKRDGTLGLLFLTPLRSWDVAIGKLSATSLSGCYALVGVLPVMAIAWLLGGVGAAEYLRAVLLIALAMAAGLAAGLAGSAVGRTIREASAVGYLLTVFALLGAFCFREILPSLLEQLGLRALSLWVTAGFAWFISPFEAFVSVESNRYAAEPWRYWAGAAGLGAEALLWGGGAVWWLGRAWREPERSLIRLPNLRRRPASAPAAPMPRRESAPESAPVDAPAATAAPGRTSDDAALLYYRGEVLREHPIAWPALRSRARNRRLAWGPMVIVTLVAAAAWALDGAREFWLTGVYIGALLASPIWKVMLASEAADAFLTLRRSGAAELLLSTPLTDREYVRGRLAALWRQFWLPGVFLGACFLVQIPHIHEESRNSTAGNEDEWLLIVGVVAQTVFLFLDGAALAWVGLWSGLSTRTGRAGLTAFFRVEVLAALLFIGTAPMLTWNASHAERRLVGLYCLTGLVADLPWLFYARHRLKVNFRSFAATGLRRH